MRNREHADVASFAGARPCSDGEPHRLRSVPAAALHEAPPTLVAELHRLSCGRASAVPSQLECALASRSNHTAASGPQPRIATHRLGHLDGGPKKKALRCTPNE